MEMALTMRQLHMRGPTCRGLAVDLDGVVLGADHVLIDRVHGGYRILDFGSTEQLLKLAFEQRYDPQHLRMQLEGIKRALNDGSLVKAQILGLQMPLAGMHGDDFARLDWAAALLKYDPDQPRDDIGRWTIGGGASDRMDEEEDGDEEAFAPPQPPLPEIPVSSPDLAPPAAAPAIEGAGPELLALLGRFAAAASGPVLLGGAFALIPTNSSNIHEGDIPGRPGLSYRADEGVLTIFRQDEQGNLQRVYEGFPDSAGLYRDSSGRVIGQHVGTGAVFNVDSLPMFGDAPDGPKASSDSGSGDDPTSPSDSPKRCPDPTPESIKGRDPAVVRYQTQITGLEPGQIVHLNGRDFDGCDEDSGDMKEAKHGQDWFFTVPPDERPSLNEYKKIMAQAEGQSNAAGERRVIWYFSNPEAAAYWRKEFQNAGLNNLGTVWEAVEVQKFSRSCDFFWEMVA